MRASKLARRSTSDVTKNIAAIHPECIVNTTPTDVNTADPKYHLFTSFLIAVKSRRFLTRRNALGIEIGNRGENCMCGRATKSIAGEGAMPDCNTADPDMTSEAALTTRGLRLLPLL